MAGLCYIYSKSFYRSAAIPKKHVNAICHLVSTGCMVALVVFLMSVFYLMYGMGIKKAHGVTMGKNFFLGGALYKVPQIILIKVFVQMFYTFMQRFSDVLPI